jgi:chromosome segregation ATPase
MQYLQKLQIKNFQIHENLEIDLSNDNITSIIGATDAGKSSIVRAMLWVLTNRPTGTAIIRDGAKTCEVALQMSSGQTVRRVRGKSKNEYWLDDQVFEAFGNDVPEPIQKVFNINEINIQQQHDAPWLFCETAGAVSRRLNAIVDLEIIDTTLKNLNSEKRENVTRLKIERETLKSAREQKREWKWAVQAHHDANELKTLEKAHIVAMNRCELGRNILQAVRSTMKKIKRLKTQYIELSQVMDFAATWKQKSIDYENATTLICRVMEIEERLEKSVPKKSDYKHLADISKTMEGREKKITTAQYLINTARESEMRITELQTKQQKTKKKYDRLIKTLGGICPLCQQPINAETS